MNAPVLTSTPQLTIYERMCSAIAQCVAVDEAKDIRDKAMALEAYYRQARNLDAEREAANVRLRAERRVGELLKELARATPEEAGAQGGRGNTKSPSSEETGFTSISEMARCKSPYASALSEHGISRQTAHKFQALASIPKADFERALSGPEKPTTKGVIGRATLRDPLPTPRVSDTALWIWGRLRDFENTYFAADLDAARRSSTDAMAADVLRIIPSLRDFIDRLEEAYEPA